MRLLLGQIVQISPSMDGLLTKNTLQVAHAHHLRLSKPGKSNCPSYQQVAGLLAQLGSGLRSQARSLNVPRTLFVLSREFQNLMSYT
eukprot:1146333-Pelagomonas_calceolata.AAC.7